MTDNTYPTFCEWLLEDEEKVEPVEMVDNIILPFPHSDPRGKYFSERIKDSWAKGDVGGVLSSMDSHMYFDFIFDNIIAIRCCGLIKEFVSYAYVGTKNNLSSYPLNLFRHLFSFCNKDALRKLNDPFEVKPFYDLYRGVSGKGRARRLRGYSWTSSLDTAKFFSIRMNLANPSVFTTRVKYDDIYFYTNNREENEFVCHIPPDAKLTRVS